jgi:hypothetical protein
MHETSTASLSKVTIKIERNGTKLKIAGPNLMCVNHTDSERTDMKLYSFRNAPKNVYKSLFRTLRGIFYWHANLYTSLLTLNRHQLIRYNYIDTSMFSFAFIEPTSGCVRRYHLYYTTVFTWIS